MLKIKNLIIGDGIPKICVPVVGRTQEEILKSAAMAAGSEPDLVEFRCDEYDGVRDPEQLTEILAGIEKYIGELPLLLTFRSKEEGGTREVSDQEYLEICRTGICSSRIDLIDLELQRYERLCRQQDYLPAEDILAQAHARKIPVLMSMHYFSHTPGEEEMLGQLHRMEELGADILKLAVMPGDKKDVLALLSATVRMSQITEKPLITMSMGDIGKISRVIGAFTGSAVTFASAGTASAPGQIEVSKMRKILNDLSD